MDSKTNNDLNSQPRSHPAFWSMTIIGGGASSKHNTNALMRLREGTGGSFGNLVLAGAAGRHVGVEIKDCGTESLTQSLPAAGTADFLHFSKYNVIHDASTDFTYSASCSASFTAKNTDPGFAGVFLENVTSEIDPRPTCGSSAYTDVEAKPNGDNFYSDVAYKGAFGNTNWLAGWSYLALTNRLATHEVNCLPGVMVGGSQSSSDSGKDDDKIPAWGVTLFIVVAVILVVLVCFMCFMMIREKEGKPIFVAFNNGGDGGSKTNVQMGANHA